MPLLECALDLAGFLPLQELELSVETEFSRLEKIVMEELAAILPLANTSVDRLSAESLLDLVMSQNSALEMTPNALKTNSSQPLNHVESSLECAMFY